MNAQEKRRIGGRVRLAAVLALMLSGLVLGAGPALAHDGLDETNPKDGSTVKALPAEIRLVFSNNPLALGSVVRVESPEGEVTEGKPEIVDNVVTQAVAPGAPAGKYTVQWRVTSSDGHPIDGEFSFTAQAGNEPEETAEPTETVAPTTPAVEPTVTATESTVSSGATTSEEDDGGTSAVLIITLIVLALVVLGAAVYVFVLAPRGSDS